MIELNNDKLRSYLATLGYRPALGQLHLFGVRSATPAGDVTLQLTDNTPNQYNDSIGVFGTELAAFKGSVDPGRSWTVHPANPRGCAHLQNGRWSYKFGAHHGRRALKQSSQVAIWRDSNHDFKHEADEPTERGFFGIDIHAGGKTPHVDDWSAGCQVIAGGWSGFAWNKFLGLCDVSKQVEFNYYLFDAQALVDFLR